MSEQPIIHISIRGTQSRCGKTTVAALITKALEEFGITDIQVQCPDGDFPRRMEQPPTVKDLGTLPKVIVSDENKPVSIVPANKE